MALWASVGRLMEIRNYAEYECETPIIRHFVRNFVYLDTVPGFVEPMADEAHTTDVWASSDWEYRTVFCWVFKWNVERFKSHMLTVLAHADEEYLDRCSSLSFFYR